MKVLLVNKFHYIKGGAERYYFSLASALEKAGHEVIFFSMKSDKNVPCKQEKYFVTNREYNQKTNFFQKISAFKNFVYSKESYNKMSQLIKDEKPDLAILNNIHRQLTTAVVDALFDNHVKTYWVVHDLIMLCPNYTMLDSDKNICEKCAGGNYKFCLKKKCVKDSFIKSYLAVKEAKYNKKHKTYDKIDKFIAPSEFYRKKLIEYGFNPNKVIHIPNLLAPDTKFELNDHDDGYLLYYGRLSKEKGIDTLIDAMININYRLIILGTGPIEESLKNKVKMLELNNIEFKGFKQGEELLNYIRNSRAVVLPSEWYENGPYSAIEALALGKPIIVSNIGGLPELAVDGKTGFIFKLNDAMSLINAINKIKNLSSKSYMDMSYNSYVFSINHFGFEKYLYYFQK